MSRYKRISTISSPSENNGAKFYFTTFYPDIPLSENDTYVLTNQGDRLDLLAHQFYGDKKLWWVISIANPSIPKNSINLPIGTQLRIPFNPNNVISLFNKIN